MRILTAYVLMTGVLLVFVSPAAAQQSVGIYANPEGTETCLSYGAPGEYYIVYKEGPPITAIQFDVPAPACGNSVILSTTSSYQMIGQAPGQLSVSFGACLSPPIHVATITVLSVSPSSEDCCGWTLANASAIDCSSNDIGHVSATTGWLKNQPCDLTPNSPSPPDGASALGFEVTMDWEGVYRIDCDLGDVTIYAFRFGTDPNNMSYQFDFGPPVVKTNLQPNTTYYWQAIGTTYNLNGPYPGPIWTFTTQGSVATEISTWSRIKSLYR